MRNGPSHRLGRQAKILSASGWSDNVCSVVIGCFVWGFQQFQWNRTITKVTATDICYYRIFYTSNQPQWNQQNHLGFATSTDSGYVSGNSS